MLTDREAVRTFEVKVRLSLAEFRKLRALNLWTVCEPCHTIIHALRRFHA